MRVVQYCSNWILGGCRGWLVILVMSSLIVTLQFEGHECPTTDGHSYKLAGASSMNPKKVLPPTPDAYMVSYPWILLSLLNVCSPVSSWNYWLLQVDSLEILLGVSFLNCCPLMCRLSNSHIFVRSISWGSHDWMSRNSQHFIKQIDNFIFQQTV